MLRVSEGELGAPTCRPQPNPADKSQPDVHRRQRVGACARGVLKGSQNGSCEMEPSSWSVLFDHLTLNGSPFFRSRVLPAAAQASTCAGDVGRLFLWPAMHQRASLRGLQTAISGGSPQPSTTAVLLTNPVPTGAEPRPSNNDDSAQETTPRECRLETKRSRLRPTDCDRIRSGAGCYLNSWERPTFGEIQAACRKLISRGQEILGTTRGRELAKLLNAKGIARRRPK